MLSQYQGMYLPPGMGTEYNTVEPDLSGLIYGGTIQDVLYVPYAKIDGAARDAGNTGNTTILRPGLVMGVVTATGKWKQFDSAAVDGTEIARGILAWSGVNTQLNGADADRWLATIIVGRACLYPTGICLASTAAYGLAQTGAGATVRKHMAFAFQFADDFMNILGVPIAAR